MGYFFGVNAGSFVMDRSYKRIYKTFKKRRITWEKSS